jgi:molybdenum cofactor cytidylyltransferase
MITALILAAGQSKRMGKPKMTLSWGETTVLGQVITTFNAAGVDDMMVVTGGHRKQVEALVGDSARTVYNPGYVKREMLNSVQVGLGQTKPGTEAILIALGDQPQVQERSVQLVIKAYRISGASIVVPSFQMHRGHPWLVARLHWDEILSMRYPETLRDFLERHTAEIHYVNINNNSILQDLDTPEDYLKSKP